MKPIRAHIYSVLVPLMRAPSYWVPVVLFPTLLYSFFGLSPSQDNPAIANILLASWSAFAVIGIGFFQFGVGIAQSRQEKWTDFVRTLPAGLGPKILAQLVTAIIFIAMALGLLWTVALLATAVDLNRLQFLKLLGVLLLGAIPFVTMGVALGYALSARAAVPIANLFYLPLAYFGGLWMPPQMLPELVQRFSPYVPTRQLGELAWWAVLENPFPWASIQGLGIYTGIFTVMAFVAWHRDDSQRQG